MIIWFYCKKDDIKNAIYITKFYFLSKSIFFFKRMRFAK